MESQRIDIVPEMGNGQIKPKGPSWTYNVLDGHPLVALVVAIAAQFLYLVSYHTCPTSSIYRSFSGPVDCSCTR